MACRTRELGWGKDLVGEVDMVSLTSTVMRYKNGDGVKGELAELAISGAFALSHTSTQ